MSAVLSVALPVFGVIAAGVLAGKFGLATADAAALNRFVFRFAMPAALFSLMSGASGLKREDGLIALAYGAPALLVMTGGYVVARTVFRRDSPAAGALALASVLGNGVFLGLPIALGVDGWARPFVDLMLVEGILVIGVGTVLMSPPVEGRRFNAAAIFIRSLKNPLVAAALAGFALATAGVVLPDPLRSFLDILGRAAGPVALFSLGQFFATRGFAIARHAREVAAIAALKMALLPALSLALLHLLGIDDPHYRGALALFTVVPTAVGAFIMASQYGRMAEETAAAVAVTTAISVISISLVLAVFA